MRDESQIKERLMSGKPEAYPPRIKPYSLVAGTLWTFVVLASLIWNVHQTKQGILDVARYQARVAYEKDLIYRRWNAMHGGVYVPISEKSPPNPYLVVPERDIATPSGIALTKMNPAYMTRQAHEMAAQAYGVLGHITSLNPIRPANAADPWETEALRAFEVGAKEVSSVEEIQGQPYLRLMRPLFTEEACLTCHGVQGYQLGDIRGGISVSLPMKPLWAVERSWIVALLLGHTLLWLFGLLGLGYGARRLAEQFTERKQAEEALRESEEMLRQLFDNMADCVAIYQAVDDGSDFVFVDINRKGQLLSVISRSDAIGRRVTDAFPAVEKIGLLDVFRHVWRTGEAQYHPLVLYEDGRIQQWVENFVFKLPSGLVVALYSDCSEKRRTEEESSRLEERLHRAEKMEALGTLAGGVAHDLNNVLGIVVGYSELLLSDLDESSPAKSQATEILKGGQRAAAIVQDLLTLARRGVPSRRVSNINNIVMECGNSPEFARLLSFHPNVKMEIDLEADVLNISGSSVHLEKSFFNLVSNAAEAMPDGGALTVKTANCYLDKPIFGYDEVRGGDYVVLSVSDTGKGIAASELKRIFEPFYTKKVMGRSGTGLGLAVVWGTVKDHLGYINVESQEGEGTTFTLYFPVTREEMSPEEVSVSAAEYMGNGESILVVDDVQEQRALACTMLRKLNYTVETVSSGEDAVEYLRDHAVDLVVLDMIMDPGIDGLDTYRKMLEIRPHQKAIVVSGFSETERVREAQSLGAGAYVKKPYVLQKLGLAVRKELDRMA